MSQPGCWRRITSGAGDPAFNMALDEALLRADPVRPTLRTYSWSPPSVSLGYFQEVTPDRLRSLRDRGWGVVRRPTGGRAIFHGDELTYSVVWPAGEPEMPRNTVAAYELVHGALALAFRRFGIEADMRGERTLLSDSNEADEFVCFYRSSAFDLVTAGRKLVGSAQRRSGRAFLMHGSVPTGPNPFSPAAAHAPVPPDRLGPVFAEELAAALSSRFEPGEATAAELANARELAEGKYATDAFTLRRARSADRW